MESPLPINEVAARLGVPAEALEPYGRDRAKIRTEALSPDATPGKLILVTAMTPTPKGAGKTVISIGLGQAFGQLDISHCVCLREPSLGPTLGMKGGAAGGGKAQLIPMEDINLHFTGDLHAVTSAHNLLAALIDNHIHFDNRLDLDLARIAWPRVMDLCDRQLRDCEIGRGRKSDGFVHSTRFDITAASEVMAVLALAADRAELEARLGRMVVAWDRAGRPRTASEVGGVGAMVALLQRALWPNLVQTVEGTPVLVHAGPFANIAHGCSSLSATRAALGLSDYVITEAGFGADLGAEKFLHIKCRQGGLAPDAAVVVANCAMLRYHGGAADDALDSPDTSAVERGLPNLKAHLDNLATLGIPALVALNRHPGDSNEEHRVVGEACERWGSSMVVAESYARGGEGTRILATQVKALADSGRANPRPLYAADAPLRDKIEALATTLYRADGVDYDETAAAELDRLQDLGFGELGVCMAKTQYSLSDRQKVRNLPGAYRMRVREVEVRAGAGFIVVKTGRIMTMPGMPRDPNALHIHLGQDGVVRGLF